MRNLTRFCMSRYVCGSRAVIWARNRGAGRGRFCYPARPAGPPALLQARSESGPSLPPAGSLSSFIHPFVRPISPFAESIPPTVGRPAQPGGLFSFSFYSRKASGNNANGICYNNVQKVGIVLDFGCTLSVNL